MADLAGLVEQAGWSVVLAAEPEPSPAGLRAVLVPPPSFERSVEAIVERNPFPDLRDFSADRESPEVVQPAGLQGS